MQQTPLNHPLAIMLSGAVPLWIEQLKRRGGPSMEEISSLEETLGPVLDRADGLLLFRGREAKDGEIANAFNQLARGIAILSYVPGGVTVFNEHYETEFPVPDSTIPATTHEPNPEASP
jgi:hypothetical protein